MIRSTSRSRKSHHASADEAVFLGYDTSPTRAQEDDHYLMTQMKQPGRRTSRDTLSQLPNKGHRKHSGTKSTNRGRVNGKNHRKSIEQRQLLQATAVVPPAVPDSTGRQHTHYPQLAAKPARRNSTGDAVTRRSSTTGKEGRRRIRQGSWTTRRNPKLDATNDRPGEDPVVDPRLEKRYAASQGLSGTSLSREKKMTKQTKQRSQQGKGPTRSTMQPKPHLMSPVRSKYLSTKAVVPTPPPTPFWLVEHSPHTRRGVLEPPRIAYSQQRPPRRRASISFATDWVVF